MRAGWSLIVVAVSVSAGCWFKGTSGRIARQEAESRASSSRTKAASDKDFATAIAYDDAFLVRAGADDRKLRADRKNHFAQLIEAKLEAIGPLSDATAEAWVGTLLALRNESKAELVVPPLERDLTGQPFAEEITRVMMAANKKLAAAGSAIRKEDLAIVDGDAIAPKLLAAADPLWRVIDGLAAKGELARAIDLGQNLVDALPAGNAYAARLQQLKDRVAAIHVTHAQQAAEVQPGARVLHARIARMYGGQVGPLADPGPVLQREIAQDWTIVSSDACGSSTGYNRPSGTPDTLDAAAASYRDPVITLENRLRKEGFPAANGGQPMQMTVTFAACKVDEQQSTEEQRIPYKDVQTVSVAVPRQICAPSKQETTSRSLPGGRIEYTTWTSGGGCYDDPGGGIDHYEQRQVVVDLVETLQITHRRTTINASGVIQIQYAGGTRDEAFSISVSSEDDISWPPSSRGTSEQRGGQVASGLTQQQVSDRLHRQLLPKIQSVAGQVLAIQAAPYTAKAKAAVAAGQTLEADQAFFIADRIVQSAGVTDPDFIKWMDTTYHLTALVLVAGVAEKPLPKEDLAAKYTVTVKPVAIVLGSGVESALSEGIMGRDRRSVLNLSLTAGIVSSTATGGAAKTGFLGSFAFTLNRRSIFGMRMSGGVTGGGGNGLLDIDFIGGYGVKVGWLRLGLIAGAGGSFSPGHDEGAMLGPDTFLIPGGVYVEYGARAQYAFERAASIELIYTKAFRTADAAPRANRGDAKLAVVLPTGFALGLTFRYEELLSEGDFYTPFTSDSRVAKMYWFLAGMGF